MEETRLSIKFEPQGRVVAALPGSKILEAAATAGLAIDTPCGATGTCGKCRVRLVDGAAEANDSEREALTAEELEDGWRLACQSELHQSCVIHVPDTSLFASKHQILASADTEELGGIEPAVCKCYVELPVPSLTDDVPDVDRLEQAVGSCKTDVGLLRSLPAKLRAERFRGTAVLASGRLLDFESGDTTAHSYGAAFDIGTTTLAGVLLDLNTGDEAGLATNINPQVTFGDDVLSRIVRAVDEAGLEELRGAVVDEVNVLLDRLCREAGISSDAVYEVTFSGNTTMQHLLCGLDPSSLGQVPFVPTQGRALCCAASDLGITIHPRGRAYVFPVVGGFVGGDTVAGILTTGLPQLDGANLMVDIGTNGEIVLAHDGQLWAASTAAGPAFEGARISCGMRATRGAIEKVVLEDDLHCNIIGDAAPSGLCGSGLIDLVAGLLDAGIVDLSGRMLPPNELPESLPEPLRRRVHKAASGGVEFLLADPPDSDAQPVTLTERDVRELQLASGAIRAGIRILLKQAGLEVDGLARVIVAGGFGAFIRRSKAQRIGLLPPELEHRRIQYVGNTSLAGAKWALLSAPARAYAGELARQTQHVELSNDTDFAMEFAMAMAFPEGVKAP